MLRLTFSAESFISYKIIFTPPNKACSVRSGKLPRGHDSEIHRVKKDGLQKLLQAILLSSVRLLITLLQTVVPPVDPAAQRGQTYSSNPPTG